MIHIFEARVLRNKRYLFYLVLVHSIDLPNLFNLRVFGLIAVVRHEILFLNVSIAGSDSSLGVSSVKALEILIYFEGTVLCVSETFSY